MPIENIEDILDQEMDDSEETVELDEFDDAEQEDAPIAATLADLEAFEERIVARLAQPVREEWRQMDEEEPTEWEKEIDRRVKAGIDAQMAGLGPAVAGLLAKDAIQDISDRHGISQAKIREIMKTLPQESLASIMRKDDFWASQATLAKTRTRFSSASGGDDDSGGTHQERMDRALAAEFRMTPAQVKAITKRGSR
jgi:hypothetical protein